MNGGGPRMPALPLVLARPMASPADTAAAFGPKQTYPDDPVGSEQYTQKYPFPAGAVGGSGEHIVYQTARRWMAVDVYLDANPMTPITFTGVVTLRIYAMMGGLRVLVASGRQDLHSDALGPFGASPAPLPTWMAGARNVAQQYQVTYEFTTNDVFPAQAGSFAVTVVASDRADSDKNLDGTLTAIGTDFGLVLASNPPPASRAELVMVGAANGAAAARWLHIHDVRLQKTDVGIDTFIPAISMPMGAAIGDGFGLTKIGFRARQFLTLVVSSTDFVTTYVNDCSISWVIR